MHRGIVTAFERGHKTVHIGYRLIGQNTAERDMVGVVEITSRDLAQTEHLRPGQCDIVSGELEIVTVKDLDAVKILGIHDTHIVSEGVRLK